MKLINWFDTYDLAAKALGKWCIVASCTAHDWLHPDAVKAAPWLASLDKGDLVHVDDRLFVAFDSEAECMAAFWSTVGEDGPTKTNPYDGYMRVSAIVISPVSGAVTENT